VKGPACTGLRSTAACLRDLAAALRFLEALISLKARELPLLNRRQEPKVQADQIGGIQAEAGEALALPYHQLLPVGQPMEAISKTSGGPGGQEGRSRLRGGHTSPDQDVRGRRGGAPHF